MLFIPEDLERAIFENVAFMLSFETERTRTYRMGVDRDMCIYYLVDEMARHIEGVKREGEFPLRMTHPCTGEGVPLLLRRARMFSYFRVDHPMYGYHIRQAKRIMQIPNIFEVFRDWLFMWCATLVEDRARPATLATSYAEDLGGTAFEDLLIQYALISDPT